MRIPGNLRKWFVTHVFDFTPFAFLFSSLASLAIVQLQGLMQHASPRSHSLMAFAYAGVAFGTALLGARKLLWRKADPLQAIGPRFQFPARIALLSAQIGIGLLPISIYFAVWQSHYDQLEWYGLSFLDKRYLFSLYWTGIFTFLVLPPLLWRILWRSEESLQPDEIRSDLPPESRTKEGRRRSLWWGRSGRLLVVLLIAYFMYGPPWNVSLLPPNVNVHEQVHLGPLQAISKGYLPGIGPAAQGYGPGFQLGMYGLMKATGHFTLVGFREAQATLDFLGYCVFALIAFRLLGFRYALVAIVLSVTVSPFRSIPWNVDGSLYIWGWPNSFRYMGSLLVTIWLSSLLLSDKEAVLKLAATGLIWGLLIWISPENLLMGAISIGMLGTLMWSTETVTFRRLARGLSAVSLGALLGWLPIAIFYSRHGALQEYLANVFQVGREVINGNSNTPVADSILQSPYLSNIMYFAAPMLLICGLAVITKDMALVRPLNEKRLLVLALICVSLTNLFGSLTRSDASHLLNVLIGFPILLALMIQNLPGLIARRTSETHFLSVVVILVALMFSGNYGPSDFRFLSTQASARIARFFAAAPAPKSSDMPMGTSLTRMGYTRFPDGMLYSSQPTLTMTELSSALDGLRAVTGDNSVFVASFPYVSPDLVYFLADLTPAPVLADPSTMVFSSEDRARFLDHLRGIASQVDFVITTDRKIPEVAIYLDAHPGATSLTRVLADKRFFIFGVFHTTVVP